MAKEPLTVGVHPAWLDRPEVKALIDEGHPVAVIEAGYDLILHPNAWRWSDELFEQLDVTVREARKVKYGDERLKRRIEAKARKDSGSRKRPKRAAAK